jgi:hypothetical protein
MGVGFVGPCFSCQSVPIMQVRISNHQRLAAYQGRRVAGAERHIEDALHDMILAGIRALLVVDATALLWLITASDILETVDRKLQSRLQYSANDPGLPDNSH